MRAGMIASRHTTLGTSSRLRPITWKTRRGDRLGNSRPDRRLFCGYRGTFCGFVLRLAVLLAELFFGTTACFPVRPSSLPKRSEFWVFDFSLRE